MTTTLDCTACGACCFGGHDAYIALLPQDRDRAIPADTTTEIDGRRYMRMDCGHCAQLGVSAAGEMLCAIYENRPEACRAFRAGSFECHKARQRRGAEAAALQAFGMRTETGPAAGAAGPVIDVPILVAADVPVQVIPSP
ncbi:YkgJ family cysteine cluster protein [Anianabacter salinae]|uniref:YkgJ family cysteine cluster protein n=1 Tax=Anianabacter salinae TaxID=2851023 RepID=UPI00225DEE97|nr:YkgJ family cysteine cluster protein [Anianabacter salinae]MBV0911524.1 YkgJ family cysteine cluster protein [Anianabacter salinae]